MKWSENMKSIRLKLTLMFACCIFAISMLIVGIWAVENIQYIKLNGSVNFTIDNDDLYVKNISIRENMEDEPHTVDYFLPGFINNEFNMALGEVDATGQIGLYFDIINRTEDRYVASSEITEELASKGVKVEVSGEIAPGEIDKDITGETDGTIALTISTSNNTTIDLSEITVMLGVSFSITLGDYDYGQLTLSTTEASQGQEVDLSYMLEVYNDYVCDIDRLYYVTEKDGVEHEIDGSKNEYSFTMPNDNVTIGIEQVQKETFDIYEYENKNQYVNYLDETMVLPNEVVIPRTYSKIEEGQEYIETLEVDLTQEVTEEMQNKVMALENFTFFLNDGTTIEFANIEEWQNYMSDNNISEEDYPILKFQTISTGEGARNISLTLPDGDDAESIIVRIVVLMAGPLIFPEIVDLIELDGTEFLNTNLASYVNNGGDTSQLSTIRFNDYGNLICYSGEDYKIDSVKLSPMFTGSLDYLLGSTTDIGALFETYGENVEKVVIPSSITDLGNAAFGNLTNATFNFEDINTLKNIGAGAFANCTKLESIIVPEGQTILGNLYDSGMFSGCTSLKEVILPESLVSIETNCFENCTSLTSITIPKNVTNIDGGDDSAFSGCTNLTTVTIECGFIFENATNSGGSTNHGYDANLFVHATMVRVLASLIDEQDLTSTYLNNTANFTRVKDGDYYIYTKVV